MESLYKSSFCIQLVAKTKPKRDISLWACTFIGYSFSISFFLMITRLFSLLFQMLKSLTDTCFNIHIFSNQSNNTSSSTVLYCYNRMYRTLTNPKLLRGLTHSGFMFDDIICDFYCPLLNVIFHKNNPCINCFLQSMQGHFDVCLHFPFVLSEFPLYKPYKPTLPRHTSNPIAPTATNTNPIPAAFFLFSITTNCLLSMEFIG